MANNVLDTLRAMCEMCGVHDNVSSKFTPRNFVDVSIQSEPILVKGVLFIFRPSPSSLHFL